MHRRTSILFSLLLAFALAIGVVVLGVGTLGTSTITVLPGDSIQYAIDQAPSGAIICLTAGIWDENITISKSLILRGSGTNSTFLYAIDDGEARSVIRVTSDQEIDVRIEQLTIKGIRRQYEGANVEELDTLSRIVAGRRWDGIAADKAVNVTLADSTVTLCRHAIVLVTRSEKQASIVDMTLTPFEGHLSVVNSSISHSTDFGLYMIGGFASIVDSDFTENRDTMRVSDHGEIDAVSSHFDRNEGPIDISAYAYGSFTDCSISHNSGFGIFVATRRGVAIVDSRIENNDSVGMYAVGGQSVIMNSRISGNEYSGICAVHESEITITACTIAQNGEIVLWDGELLRNGDGITIEDSAHVTLIGNDIVDNAVFGVAFDERFDPFVGYVGGHGNRITGPSEVYGNGEAAVSPAELSFLKTSEGGELDRRSNP